MYMYFSVRLVLGLGLGLTKTRTLSTVQFRGQYCCGISRRFKSFVFQCYIP